MIGDRFKDIIPANKLGIKAIFLDYKYKEEKPKKFLKNVNQFTKLYSML